MKRFLTLAIGVLLALLAIGCTSVTPGVPSATPTRTAYPTFTPTVSPTNTHIPTSTPTATPTLFPTVCPLAATYVHCYLDGNKDGVRQSNEAGVRCVVLLGLLPVTNASTLIEIQTDPQTGAWSGGLAAGKYSIILRLHDAPVGWVIDYEMPSIVSLVPGANETIMLRFVPWLPTWTPTVTPLPTAVPVAVYPPAGNYILYDYPCTYPLTWGYLPNGTIMQDLCPNGLYSDRTFKNNNAFKTAGGLDWDKMRAVYPEADYVRMGGNVWVSWAELNPSEGVYNWNIIDSYVNAAKLLTMDTPNGIVPKGVVVRLYNSMSNRPAMQQPVSGIDGGFIFDDLTPSWVKGRMIGNVTWGGPTVLSSGNKVTQDNGSYWVKMPCVYKDYQASKPQGSNWGYSIWVVPKYNHPAWKAAATRFLHDVAAHYDGSDVTFLVGLAGMDSEFGNYVQNSFAGCEGLREALGAQTGASTNTMIWPEMAAAWRSGSQTTKAYVSCTSDCNAAWFVGQNVGIFQARAVDDGPNYHRTGDIGALDWAVRFAERGLPVAWEAAYTVGETPYMYRMLSVIAPSWPQWFSFVGGSWQNSDMARYALTFLGKSVTTTQAVWWKSYWTCFGEPDVIDCQNTTLDEGNWSQYSGWPYNIEVGLVTTATMPLVNPWTQLTAEQRTHEWALMLRSLSGTAIWRPDTKWKAGNGNRFIISVDYIDIGVGTTVLSWGGASVTLERKNTGSYVTHKAYVTGSVQAVTLTVTGAPLWIHGVRVEVWP